MDNRAGDEHEEELDFHLGTAGDSSSDDESMSSNSSLSSMGKDIGGDAQRAAPGDGNCAYDKDIFTRMAAGAGMNNTLDEYWDIVKKTFATEGEAYIFYNKYAKDKGFSVRKAKVRRAKYSGELLFRRFLCSREGEREIKWLEKEDLSRRPRALSRCFCQAKLEIRLDRTRGAWYVSNFVDEHNHRLATKDEVPFLWSHWKMKDFQKTEIMSMEAIGIRKHVIMDVLQCRYGGYSEVGIIRKDAYNFSSRYKRARIAEGDAMTVLGLMQNRQKTDPDFYYDYQLDSDGRLRTMFWCDSQSHMDYQSFGDVVVFDSTYQMNRYKMPFVPFVGMSQHRSTTANICATRLQDR